MRILLLCSLFLCTSAQISEQSSVQFTDTSHICAKNTAIVVYKQKCKEIATAAKIPLIQLAFKSGDKIGKSGQDVISFESSQSDSIKESPDCSSVFQAASLGKPVLAYIALKMADKGEIDLNRPLYHYTDIDRFINKEWAKLLTARMVLTHRTGLPNWATSPSSAEWPTSTIEFKFRPDSCYGYSGEGIALLQRAIENIRRKSLQEIASEDVFIPLGMVHSSYEWRSDYDSVAVCGYDKDGRNCGQGRHPRANAAYTLRTTANDYMLFLKALAEGKGLKPGTHKYEFLPAINAKRYSDRERPCDNYIFWGLCVGIEKNPELGNIIFHWGDNGNFKGLFIILPGQKEFGRDRTPDRILVYFTNSAHGHDIIDQIVPLFFKNKEPLQLSSWINN